MTRLRPLLWAALLLVVLGLFALPTGAAERSALQPRPAQQDDPAPPTTEAPAEDAAVDPFDRLAGCIGGSGRLLVVLLVDESASLRETDPDDERVAAAQTALASLDLLRGGGQGDSAVDIDVLVSTFSYDFTKVGEWTTLSDQTRPVVDAQIAGLADRDASMDTDFHNALDGARRTLADRATETTAGAGGEVCKAILLFTDGAFTLGVRDTPEKVERYGLTKTYAPGLEMVDQAAVDEVTQKGIEATCRNGGVADQVRADRITVLSVPLGQGSDLLEAITVGKSPGRTCGDPDTDHPGVYLPAADTAELLRTFDLVGSRIGGGSLVGEPLRAVPCADEVCDKASARFTVSPSLRRVHIFAAGPTAETEIVVVPPGSDPIELASGETVSELGGLPARVVWLTDQAVTIDLDVPGDGIGEGEWTVALVGGVSGDARGSVHVVTYSDLVAQLGGDSRLRLGSESTLSAQIVTRDGEEPTEDLSEATVSATLTDPISGESAPVTFTAAEDGFTAKYTVEPSVTAAALRVTLRLDAVTASGARVTSVSPEQDLAVLRPEGYPQVSPPRLAVASITGNGKGKGELILVPSGGTGCAWLDGIEVRSAPVEAGTFSVAADGIGEAKGACTPVTAPLTVPIEVDASGRASGTVSGHVRLFLAAEGGDSPIATDVPFSLEMARGVDEAKRLVLAAVLMIAGMLVPLLLLLLINKMTTRFQPLANVRAARIPVVVGARDQMFRIDADGRHVLVLTDADFAELDAEGGDRAFTWGGLTFRARTSLNPFAEPHATVAAEGGGEGVSREGRRTDLALGLAGSWLFLLDQDATRAAAERLAVPGQAPSAPTEIHGQVVAFVSAGAVAAQASTLLNDVLERLPATARRLTRLTKR